MSSSSPSSSTRCDEGEFAAMLEKQGEALASALQDKESCLICMEEIEDQCVLPACQHSLFCFPCILQWSDIHRRCPLCSTAIGEYVIHMIRDDADCVRHRLPQLCGRRRDGAQGSEGSADPLHVQAEAARRNLFRPRVNEARSTDFRQEAVERWERQLSTRRRVYRQTLYCQHVGSNRRSRLAAPPTPSTIAQSPSMQGHMLQFIRRELIAFPGGASKLDIDFISMYSIKIFASLDIKSDESVRLLADFLTLDGAEHFCHEVYSFARFLAQGAGSYPDKLAAFDSWAHYRWPEDRMGTTKTSSECDTGSALRHDASNEAIGSSSCSEQGGQMSEPSSEDQRSSLRAEIIQRRAKLLARLDSENGKGKSSEAVITTEFVDDGSQRNVPQPSLLDEREKRLKRLLRQKRRPCHANGFGVDAKRTRV